MRNLIYAQLILVPVMAGIVAALYGQAPAVAALYGGCIAIANSLMMARRIVRANKTLKKDPQSDVLSLYVGAVERFALTLVAMGIGMGYLMLHPLALLSGFGFAHVAYFFSRVVPASNSGNVKH